LEKSSLTAVRFSDQLARKLPLDIGELVVADRWWDLAIGSWSVTWNLGPGLEELFYSSYGAEAHQQKIGFFRLLYDLIG
jgi:kanamycin kinase